MITSTFVTLSGVYFLLKLLIYFVIKIGQWIYTYGIGKLIQENLNTKFGTWAVVTGGTDGIGKAYARELARRGMNIFIISRNMEKLNAVAKEIERDFNVSTKILQMDFSEGGRSYEDIGAQLKHLDIGILVNNVGVIMPYPLVVSEMTEALIWNHVNVNTAATILMTRILLPDMMLRGRGIIVNFSSFAQVGPDPFITVYAASKRFVDDFSEALRHECLGSGVQVQTLRPGYVNTQMVKYSKTLSSGGILVPSAELFTKNAVSTLGVANTTSGYWPHEVQYWLCSLLPVWMWIKISARNNKNLREEYNRTLTKSN